MNSDPVLSREICVPAGTPVKRWKTLQVWPRTLTGQILSQWSSLGREGNPKQRELNRGRKVELIGERRVRLSCLSECVGGVAGMLVGRGGTDEKLMGQTG